jgi:hypothetical protein
MVIVGFLAAAILAEVIQPNYFMTAFKQLLNQITAYKTRRTGN